MEEEAVFLKFNKRIKFCRMARLARKRLNSSCLTRNSLTWTRSRTPGSYCSNPTWTWRRLTRRLTSLSLNRTKTLNRYYCFATVEVCSRTILVRSIFQPTYSPSLYQTCLSHLQPGDGPSIFLFRFMRTISYVTLSPTY